MGDNLVNVVLVRKKYENEVDRQNTFMDYFGNENVQIIKSCSKLDFLIKLKNLYDGLDKNVERVGPVQVSKEYRSVLDRSDLCPESLKDNVSRLLGSIDYLKMSTFSSAHDKVVFG